MDADSNLIGEFIAEQLEKRIPFRRATRQAIQKAQNSVLAQAEGAVEKIADIQTNVDFNADISALTTKASNILARPEVQAKISSDIASAQEQQAADIQSGIDLIPDELSAVIPPVKLPFS